MDKIWEYIKLHYSGILRSISLVCIACLVAVLWMKPIQTSPRVQKTLDSLTKANTELKHQLLVHDDKIIKFNSRIDSIGYVVKSNYDKQNLLKIEYDKKINSINDFTSSDVYSYFISRYSSDTSKIK